MADYSMANRKIPYTLGRGRAYIFDMSSTCGYMGEKYFQEFGARFFLTCPQLVRTWVQNIFRQLVPYFLTCPQLVGAWVKNIFRNSVPDFLTCLQLVGTWVKNMFRVAMTWHEHADTQNSDTTRHGNY